MLRITEQNYYSSMLEKQNANVKETWKILNEVINKRKHMPTYPEYFLKKHKHIMSELLYIYAKHLNT